MAHALSHTDVLLNTGATTTVGKLMFSDDVLCAILGRVDEGDDMRGWFLEIGFGVCEHHPGPIFGSLDDAEQWLRERLGAARWPPSTFCKL